MALKMAVVFLEIGVSIMPIIQKTNKIFAIVLLVLKDDKRDIAISIISNSFFDSSSWTYLSSTNELSCVEVSDYILLNSI